MASETVTNPGIYVCGTPSGGTSCVAGILHHLGVDMGNFDPKPGHRGYVTFEDRDAAGFVRPMGRHKGDTVLATFAGPRGARDFRGYLAMRKEKANGKPWGCKLGTNYPMSDPDPATLPVKWVFVDRDLEASIRSDRAKREGLGDHPVERPMQIAGYWAAKEWLKDQLCKVGVSFDRLRLDPFGTVGLIAHLAGIDPNLRRLRLAADSVL